MRNLLFMLLLSFLGNAVNAQKITDDLLIKNILSKQTTAWNDGNLEKFMDSYWRNDSLMFIGKNGLNYGWENTLKNYKKGYPNIDAMGKLDFTLIDVKRLSPEYYSVVGKWHLKRLVGDIGGTFTLLFRKIKRQWLIIQDHSS